MSSSKVLFPTSSNNSSNSIPIENAVDGVNLRQEFSDLIYGTRGETPIGQKFILRRVRRDSSDNPVRCACVGDTSYSASSDWGCQYCGGFGYLWDEELITGYKVITASSANSDASINLQKTEYGFNRLPSIKFFFKYDKDIKNHDIIALIKLDEDGDPVVPYKRIRYYELTLDRDMRADNGRIDFIVCNAQAIGPETIGR